MNYAAQGIRNRGKEEIEYHLQKYDPNDPLPYRVAVGGNAPGLYIYGSHTEKREYADYTIGWARDKRDATNLLCDAWDYIQTENRNA
jgi:hypothetical protein